MSDFTHILRDPERLAALRKTGLLDTPPEDVFDRLTRLATKILDVPVSFIALVDEDRDFYKSQCGFGEPLASGREITGTTFCHYTIPTDRPLLIRDTRADPVYREVPTVKSLGIVAYAGIPLVTSEGHALGSFCAVDFEPRQWRETDVEVLTELAASTVREIELRVEVAERRRVEEERLQLLEREREARGEAERRAVEEAALRRAAEAVTSSFTVEETSHRIAESALDATRADGAFVERIDIERGEAEVIASAGDPAPPLAARIPYQGSYTQLVVERMEAELIPSVAAAERPLPADLAERCGDCSALVVPLLNAGEPIGTLILLRRAERNTFRADEIARAQTFGNLAALAFRKIHLLEESKRRREEIERVTESRARLIRGFSHDLKNPLGAADGHAALLEDGILGELEPRQLNSVGRIRASISSALGLINDLVELARAEAGQIEIQSGPTDVRE
ncbi:MAG TPA: GAF domain-containing protein, partial [Longimicrobiaceae bacterium]|nr:GAF domain-containing protein [Longimicrobiaceae bacterium]